MIGHMNTIAMDNGRLIRMTLFSWILEILCSERQTIDIKYANVCPSVRHNKGEVREMFV